MVYAAHLGRLRQNGKWRRVRERYKFLREKFGLEHEEATRLAKELETWWERVHGSQAR